MNKLHTFRIFENFKIFYFYYFLKRFPFVIFIQKYFYKFLIYQKIKNFKKFQIFIWKFRINVSNFDGLFLFQIFLTQKLHYLFFRITKWTNKENIWTLVFQKKYFLKLLFLSIDIYVDRCILFWSRFAKMWNSKISMLNLYLQNQQKNKIHKSKNDFTTLLK